MEITKNSPDYIFEVSWEVCNLVGGIYTVLSTKAKTLQKIYKDRIIFIGPDVWQEKKSPYFSESKTLLKEWRDKLVLPQEMKIRVGRWNIPGKPIAILVDFRPMYSCKNELYGQLWNLYGVNSLPAYGDYDEGCAFAYSSALVIENFYRFIQGERLNVVAHFNEWTTAAGLLHVKHNLPKVATIFTTHATSIGRSIAGNEKPLYDYLAGYNGDQMAEELNMVSKHSIEKQAALQADCFTTVSDITARECTQLLDRKPDIVTPNGFEENFVPQGEAYEKSRKQARERLLAIAGALLGYKPSPKALLVATSGRYEYRNKGINLFIDALKRLSQRNDIKREIIAFVMVPAWVDAPREDLKERLASKKSFDTPLTDPVITHTLFNYNQDKVVSQLHYLGLNNAADAPVKVIFIPSYLTGNDGIVNLPYYEVLPGLDVTAFPSYYEPWGYTPLESVAFGVPTITPALSGFGQWIIGRDENGLKNSGVEVLHRTDSNFEKVSENLADSLFEISKCPAKVKAEMNLAARKTAQEAEWKKFIVYYEEAFDIALTNAKNRNSKS